MTDVDNIRVKDELTIKGISISTPDEFEPSLQAIARVLGRGDIDWRAHWLENKRLSIQLVAPEATRFFTFHDGRTVASMFWFQRNTIQFWMSVELVFFPRRGVYLFDRATLGVFAGNAGPQYEVLRAEWEGHDDDTDHAQPHWHIYKSEASHLTETLATSTESSPADYINKREPDETDVLNASSFAKFHFAMAAQWPFGTSEGSLVKVTPQRLHDWLLGCLEYTRTQLQHIT